MVPYSTVLLFSIKRSLRVKAGLLFSIKRNLRVKVGLLFSIKRSLRVKVGLLFSIKRSLRVRDRVSIHALLQTVYLPLSPSSSRLQFSSSNVLQRQLKARLSPARTS